MPTLGVWLNAGLGTLPSSELIAASREVGFRERLRTQRCVRRGRPADDAASARYAVALAREKQRQWSRLSGFRKVYTAAVYAVITGLLIAGAVALHTAAGRVVSAVLAVCMALTGASLRARQRRSAAAERANVAALNRAGSPYAAPTEATPAELPLWFVASSTVAQAAFIWAGFSFGPRLVFGKATAGHAEPVNGLVYTSTFIALTWFGRRGQRRRPDPPLGPCKPHEPYRTPRD